MKKLIILILLFSSLQQSSMATLSLDEIREPKEQFYRFGNLDRPETPINFDIEPVIYPTVKKEVAIEDYQDLTYADLSIKKMALEISKSIDVDYNEMQSDLSLLWQGAATRSDTIKFAIYKLSNPDKDKPDSGAVKKVLTTIAGMSTFIGAGMGNPVLASAALIGGNTSRIMSTDT